MYPFLCNFTRRIDWEHHQMAIDYSVGDIKLKIPKVTEYTTQKTKLQSQNT